MNIGFAGCVLECDQTDVPLLKIVFHILYTCVALACHYFEVLSL